MLSISVGHTPADRITFRFAASLTCLEYPLLLLQAMMLSGSARVATCIRHWSGISFLDRIRPAAVLQRFGKRHLPRISAPSLPAMVSRPLLGPCKRGTGLSEEIFDKDELARRGAWDGKPIRRFPVYGAVDYGAPTPSSRNNHLDEAGGPVHQSPSFRATQRPSLSTLPASSWVVSLRGVVPSSVHGAAIECHPTTAR